MQILQRASPPELNDTTAVVTQTSAALLFMTVVLLGRQNDELQAQLNIVQVRLGELFVYANTNNVPTGAVRPGGLSRWGVKRRQRGAVGQQHDGTRR